MTDPVLRELTRTLLHDTLTPVDTPFQVECAEDPSGIDVVSFRGQDLTSQGEFQTAMCSEEQAVQAAVALLYRYAPKALESWVVDGLDDGDEIEVMARKGFLITIDSQPKPEVAEL